MPRRGPGKFAGHSCAAATLEPLTTGVPTMRNTMVLIATVLFGGLSSLPAQAQWNNYGYNGTLVRCESRDGRTERCSTGGGDTQLVRQFSDNACIRNRTWGTDSRGI